MDAYVPPLGALCLGAVVGWLVRYFIRRFRKFGPAALGATISLILGGAVLNFLDNDRTVWWFYPIGLVIGFAVYHLIASRHRRSPDATGRVGGSGGDDNEPLYNE